MLSTVIDVTESGAGWCGMVQCHLIYNANANCSINRSKCAATSGRLGGFTKWPPPLYHINFPSGRNGRSVRCQVLDSSSLYRALSTVLEVVVSSELASDLFSLSYLFMGIERLNWFIAQSFVNVLSFVKS